MLKRPVEPRRVPAKRGDQLAASKNTSLGVIPKEAPIPREPTAPPAEKTPDPLKELEAPMAKGQKQQARQNRKLKEEQAKQDRKAREAEAKFNAKAAKAEAKQATRTERASHSGERAAAIGGAISSSFEAVSDVAGAYMETLGAPGDALGDAMSEMDDDSDVGSTKSRPEFDPGTGAQADSLITTLQKNPIPVVVGLVGLGLGARKMGWI